MKKNERIYISTNYVIHSENLIRVNASSIIGRDKLSKILPSGLRGHANAAHVSALCLLCFFCHAKMPTFNSAVSIP